MMMMLPFKDGVVENRTCKEGFVVGVDGGGGGESGRLTD